MAGLHGTDWHGTDWHGTDWHGTDWHGTDWHGTDWHDTGMRPSLGCASLRFVWYGVLVGCLALLGCTPKRTPPTEPWESEPLADWIRAEKPVPALPPPAGYADYGEHLRASIRSQSRGLQRCYRQVLKRDRRLYGELVMRLTIQADGRLSAVEVDYGTLQGPELETCVTAHFRTLTVPTPPRDGFSVRYPLVFTSSRTPPEVVDALRRRYQLAAPEDQPEEKSSRPPADPIPW